MTDKRYAGEIERLRSPERFARLEVDRVTSHALSDLTVGRALDVGTGSAIFAESFAQQGWQVAGIDVREDMLLAARDFVPSGEFKIGTAENLPFEDGTFDLIFYGHVLHEVSDIPQTLREAFRVATRRVVVLEWPYEVGEVGPPLDHRLQPEPVLAQATEVGFRQATHHRLTHMHLLIFEK